MVRDRGDDDALIEELAAIEHERWSHWQRYVHGKAVRQPDGSLILPAELVERWERQFGSRYEDLPEDEKESDREQVRRYLPVLKGWSQDNEKRSG
ncbi:hypothetical protein MBRA_00960 [Methylobacterium brachiatum]|nr:hypothetical protein MBRA_00960 [Methylobacterium brachiatum]